MAPTTALLHRLPHEEVVETPDAALTPEGSVGLDVALAAAEAIAADGPDRHATAIELVVADARRRRLNPVLVDVLGDPSQAPVARQRALGLLLGDWPRR